MNIEKLNTNIKNWIQNKYLLNFATHRLPYLTLRSCIVKGVVVMDQNAYIMYTIINIWTLHAPFSQGSNDRALIRLCAVILSCHSGWERPWCLLDSHTPPQHRGSIRLWSDCWQVVVWILGGACRRWTIVRGLGDRGLRQRGGQRCARFRYEGYVAWDAQVVCDVRRAFGGRSVSMTLCYRCRRLVLCRCCDSRIWLARSMHYRSVAASLLTVSQVIVLTSPTRWMVSQR